MKIVALLARILLGLVFVFFGLNGFLHFLPNPGLPPGVAGQFVGALFASHYIYLVSGVQVLAGALLLINRYSVLGLTLLGPVIVNILAFHILMNSMGLSLAIFVALLWCIAAWHYRRHFAGLFVQRAE
jgi:uncharacterized membrane protein YphA (DoxX/SURF4 family)